LIGLALPALHRARATNRRLLCLANLRSLATASLAYVAEDGEGLVLPAHPTADSNPLHDDGCFDFGGADGADDAWGGGRVGPDSLRAARTRPLNRLLWPTVDSSHGFAVYRCPADTLFDVPVDYSDWVIWEATLRRRSAFATVGTSYWGNAIKGAALAGGSADGPVVSIGPYLRALARIPAPADTALYLEMPALFNLYFVPAESGGRIGSLGIAGWHEPAPLFGLAFCDGHAGFVALPAGWLSDSPDGGPVSVRHGVVRFDCFPDPPIVDRPVGG